jgi:hypothetical protein
MLEDARAVAGDSGEPASDDCRSIRGIQHAPVEGARRGVAQPIEVLIGGDVSPARVVVMYRPEGAIDFTEGRLTRQGGCRYTGAIPAAAMHGAVVHYYIAAYDANNRVLAARGSSGAPAAIDLVGAGEARADVATEPPVTAPDHASTGVVTRATPIAHHPRFVLTVSGGTGFGYVSGKTEDNNIVQQCCIGSSPVVLSSEFRYNLGPRLSVGAVARFGLPLGANIAGHSTIAPAGFVRVGYGLSDSGRGLRVMAELGFGILRNTIKLSTEEPGMDTDVVAQGPLLIGAGVGYAFRLSDALAIVVDLDAIAGLAVVDKLGTAVHLNTGIGADMRAGVAVGF